MGKRGFLGDMDGGYSYGFLPVGRPQVNCPRCYSNPKKQSKTVISSVLSTETIERLNRKTPAENRYIILSAVNEINRGNTASLDKLIKKRL